MNKFAFIAVCGLLSIFCASVFATGLHDLIESQMISPESIKLYIKEHPEDINKKDGKGRSPLYFACQIHLKGKFEIVQLLLNNGADVDLQDIYGQTPLFLMCKKGNLALVELLLKNGADVNKADNSGWTPLYVARKNGFRRIAGLLQKKGGSSSKTKDSELLKDENVNKNNLKELKQKPLGENANKNNLGESTIVVKTPLVKEKKIDLQFLKPLPQSTLPKLVKVKTPPAFASKRKHGRYIGISFEAIKQHMKDHPEDINKKDEAGRPPLLLACQKGELETVKKFLEIGANINLQDKDGRSSLFLMCKKGNQELVELLINKGADVNLQDKDGQTPLHVACKNGFLEIVKLLIEKQANIGVKNNEGKSAYDIASEEKNEQKKIDLQKLLNPLPQSTLPKLVKEGGSSESKTKDSELLKDENANKNNLGESTIVVKTPLVKEKKIDLQKLVKPLPQSTLPKFVKVKTPPAFTNKRKHGRYIGISFEDIKQHMKDHPEDINKKDDAGRPPLLLACQKGELETVKKFLEIGANINLQDKDGRSSLFLMCKKGNLELVKLLINNGADVNKAANFGWTPLHAACKNDSIEIGKLLEIVRLLINKGANIKAKNGDEKTAYDIAVELKKINEGEKTDLLELLNPLPQSTSLKKSSVSNSGLHDLIKLQGVSLTRIKQYIKEHPGDIDKKIKGITPLFLACQRGNQEQVELLVGMGADVNKDCYKWTPLHAACKNGSIKIVELLVKKGANIWVQDRTGKTAYDIASEEKKTELLKFLGSLPQSTLPKLVKEGDSSELKTKNSELLKDDNANKNNLKELKQNPLDENVNKNNLVTSIIVVKTPENKIDQQLLKPLSQSTLPKLVKEDTFPKSKMKDIKRPFVSRLHGLILSQSINLTQFEKYIKKHPGAINLEDKDGRSPLFFACQKDKLEIVKRLLDEGAKINFQDRCGRTSLFLLCQTGNLKLVELLINKGADVNKDCCGRTPLYVACEHGYTEIVQLLLNNGANVNGNDSLDTPLAVACEHGYTEIVQLLLNKGACVNGDDFGWTPLNAACEGGYIDIVKLLIGKGAGVNKDSYGWTPLHAACRNGCVKIVQLLLENGANIKAKNEDGKTAYDIALKEKKIDLIKYLKLLPQDELSKLVELDSTDIDGKKSDIKDENSELKLVNPLATKKVVGISEEMQETTCENAYFFAFYLKRQRIALVIKKSKMNKGIPFFSGQLKTPNNPTKKTTNTPSFFKQDAYHTPFAYIATRENLLKFGALITDPNSPILLNHNIKLAGNSKAILINCFMIIGNKAENCFDRIKARINKNVNASHIINYLDQETASEGMGVILVGGDDNYIFHTFFHEK